MKIWLPGLSMMMKIVPEWKRVPASLLLLLAADCCLWVERDTEPQREQKPSPPSFYHVVLPTMDSPHARSDRGGRAS